MQNKLMTLLAAFGDFAAAPKKTCLSLRRKQQFAMIGPAANTGAEAGVNFKRHQAAARLEAMPPKRMCAVRVRLTAPEQAGNELTGWLSRAHHAAGEPSSGQTTLSCFLMMHDV